MLDPGRSGGGVFDLLIHDVDFCLHLFGKPETLLATGYEDLAAGIDCLHVQFFYPHGVVTVEGGWFNPQSYPFSAEYMVALDGGAIEYHSGDPAPVAYERDASRRELAASGADGYAAEIQYFVECCRARCAPELCPPVESAEAVKVMRLILEARRRKGARMVCKI
jgi:predicted dehydrogenase